MSGRTPHAAKVLRDQLNVKLRRNPEGGKAADTMTPVGEPDGLGTYRTFAFDGVASKVLAGLLEGGWEDPRIAGVEREGTAKSPKVTLTFTSSIGADSKEPFPLDAVDDEEESTDQT